MRERLINQYWKFRRYYWKYKFLIRKVLITSYESISSIRLPFGKIRSTIYWKAFSLSTSIYWKFRKTYDISRLFVIRSLWKLKAVLNYVTGYSLGYCRHFAVRGYWKFRKMYDISRLFVIRSLWKLKAVLNYVTGYSLGYCRHFAVRGYWKFRRNADYLNEAGPGILLQMRKTKIIFHPFKKAYWFLSYQAQKRIFSIFRKNTKSD